MGRGVVVGNERTHNAFADFFSTPGIKSCILSGVRGIGKRTFICEFLRERGEPYVLLDGIDIQSMRQVTELATLSRDKDIFLILDNFDGAREDVQNTFLKTLEESSGVTFFIIAHNLDALLQTVRSRVPVFHFFPLSKAEMVSLLRTRGVENQGEVEHMIAQSGGIPLFLEKEFISSSDFEGGLCSLFAGSLVERLRVFHACYLNAFQENPILFFDRCILFLQKDVQDPRSRKTIKAILELKRNAVNNTNLTMQFEDCIVKL